MIKRQLLFAGVVAAALPTVAHAESLRCQNGIAAEGDSRLAVVYKCGQPALRDNYCAPVYYSGSVNTAYWPAKHACQARRRTSSVVHRASSSIAAAAWSTSPAESTASHQSSAVARPQ